MAKNNKKGSKSGRQGAKQTPEGTPVWTSRVLQTLITIAIVLVFWNLLDYIIDEFIIHESYAFDPYYDLALPALVGLAVELFPKRRN